jgi:hypothetical protein
MDEGFRLSTWGLPSKDTSQLREAGQATVFGHTRLNQGVKKDRLSKVQATLGQYFRESGAVGEQAASADGDGQERTVTRPAPDADGEDDNIPF